MCGARVCMYVSSTKVIREGGKEEAEECMVCARWDVSAKHVKVTFGEANQRTQHSIRTAHVLVWPIPHANAPRLRAKQTRGRFPKKPISQLAVAKN